MLDGREKPREGKQLGSGHTAHQSQTRISKCASSVCSAVFLNAGGRAGREVLTGISQEASPGSAQQLPRMHSPAWSLPASQSRPTGSYCQHAPSSAHLPTHPHTHLPTQPASQPLSLPRLSPACRQTTHVSLPGLSIQILKGPSLTVCFSTPTHASTRPSSSSPTSPGGPPLSPSPPYADPTEHQVSLCQSQWQELKLALTV